MIAVIPFDGGSIVRKRFELGKGIKFVELLDNSWIGGREVGAADIGICW